MLAFGAAKTARRSVSPLGGMITLAVYKRFEQPWRWGMLLYWVALIASFGISALRQPGTSVTTLQILAVVPAFISMALFGLYTGEVSVRTRTMYRAKNPTGFWLYFTTNLLLAGMFLCMAVFGRKH